MGHLLRLRLWVTISVTGCNRHHPASRPLSWCCSRNLRLCGLNTPLVPNCKDHWKAKADAATDEPLLRYIVGPKDTESVGAGIAQWLEHRTRDWKVAGSNPCWNGGRIFFSRVDFLCWLLFRYPFHPRVTTVARKKSRSFCQKRCRWQVTAKHAYTLRMWILLNRASALVTTCP